VSGNVDYSGMTYKRRETPAPPRPAILDERDRIYGDPRPNHERIAGLWSAFLGTKVTPHDVAWLFILAKASRSKADPSHADNYEDTIGYAHIAAELA
jgi:hypothetical protein